MVTFGMAFDMERFKRSLARAKYWGRLGELPWIIGETEEAQLRQGKKLALVEKRVRELERRNDELERRVRDLED